MEIARGNPRKKLAPWFETFWTVLMLAVAVDSGRQGGHSDDKVNGDKTGTLELDAFH